MITGTAKKMPLQVTLEYDDEPKVLLIDADSIPYIAHHGTEDDLEMSKFKTIEKVREIIINVGEYFNIVKILVFVKGEDNFRYKIDSGYKGNRGEKHPHIELLYQHLAENYTVIVANGGEADDYVYTAWNLSNGQSVIATLDKDLKSFCHGHFYNYRNGEFCHVTKEEALYNFRIQLLIGDAGDNVKTNKGFGIKGAEKIVKKNMSHFSYMRELINVYRKYTGEHYKQAIKNVYNLLCLHHVQELNTLNLQYGSR